MDFDFDNHRNSENPTIRPSIVINTYDGTDGACGLGPMGDGANYGVIRVLDGRTCKQQYVIADHVNGATTPVVGDVDGDGHADIVAINAAGGLSAFGFDQKQGKFVTLWKSHDKAGVASNPMADTCTWAAPALADLDDDGKPEALLEGVVYNSTGVLVDGAVGKLAATDTVGQFPVVADVMHDGVPRLVTPRRMLKWDKQGEKWDADQTFQGPTPPSSSEYVAIADFGTVHGNTLDRSALDGVAEIAVVSQGKAWLLSAAGAVIFGPVSLPGSKGGGPPTVGDFDHDGRPEFAAAGSDSYTVFDPDCVAGADAKFCPTGKTGGILWTSASQDHSSNITGSSLFDFEGDGTAKAVYADECFARIYSGKTGEVLFSQEHSSCTWTEYPVVADVQGNFRSKLIVPSNIELPMSSARPVDPVFLGLRCQAASDCPSGQPLRQRLLPLHHRRAVQRGRGRRRLRVPRRAGGGAGDGPHLPGGPHRVALGIRVFGDVADRWVSSRPLWNEHTYSVTNVGDDGTIPRTSARLRNWEQPGLNNFHQNVQGTLSPQSTPDLTVRADADAVCRDTGITLTAKILQPRHGPGRRRRSRDLLRGGEGAVHRGLAPGHRAGAMRQRGVRVDERRQRGPQLDHRGGRRRQGRPPDQRVRSGERQGDLRVPMWGGGRLGPAVTKRHVWGWSRIQKLPYCAVRTGRPPAGGI